MDYFKVWEFHFESEKIYIFERRQGESVADLGKGLGGPASSPPPLFFRVKKKRFAEGRKAGRASDEKKPSPTSESGDTFLYDVDYVHSGQIPDHYILSLCNASWGCLWMKTYVLLFLCTFHRHERYWIGKISWCWVFKKINPFSMSPREIINSFIHLIVLKLWQAAGHLTRAYN